VDHSGFEFVIRIRALALEIDHIFAEIAADENVHVEDMLLLFALRRRGPPYWLKPTEIYDLLNITSGAATYRIERLVKRGITERVPDPDDRRGYRVRISDEGMQVVDRAVEAVAKAGRDALTAADFDAVQLTALSSTLSRLERGWEKIIPPTENPLVQREKTVIGRRDGNGRKAG
jgi:DNA-binding MarR family transcriptional regulator